jgi:hypothetical protein
MASQAGLEPGTLSLEGCAFGEPGTSLDSHASNWCETLLHGRGSDWGSPFHFYVAYPSIPGPARTDFQNTTVVAFSPFRTSTFVAFVLMIASVTLRETLENQTKKKGEAGLALPPFKYSNDLSWLGPSAAQQETEPH